MANVNSVGPRSFYDEGKRCVETLFFDYRRKQGWPIKVAPIFITYAPWMHPANGRLVSNLVMQALRCEPITIYGDGSETGSICFVDYLIEGFLAYIEAPVEVNGPLNLGNPAEFTILELAIRLTGSASRIVRTCFPEDV